MEASRRLPLKSQCRFPDFIILIYYHVRCRASPWFPRLLWLRLLLNLCRKKWNRILLNFQNNTAVTPIVAIHSIQNLVFHTLLLRIYLFFKRSFKGLMDASTDNMPFFGFLSSQFGLFHIVVEISPAYSS